RKRRDEDGESDVKLHDELPSAGSHHSWQIRAPRVALVADAGAALARAVSRQLVEPFDDSAVAAVAVNQPVQGITTESPALRTFTPDHGELAEQVRERGAERTGHIRIAFSLACSDQWNAQLEDWSQYRRGRARPRLWCGR